MSNTQIALRPTWFWQWEEEGRVLAWSDGSTIAFVEEIEKLYRGLPSDAALPFGAVVLLLAACQEFPTAQGECGRIESLLMLLASQQQIPKKLASVALQELQKLGELPAQQRKPLPARIDLIRALLESVRGGPWYVTVQSVVDAIAEGKHRELLQPLNGAGATSPLVGDLNWLVYALQRFDVRAFALRRQTGLDALPTPAEVEIPPGAAIRQLMAALENDETLGAVSRIAQQMLAAAQLPRRLSEQDELPVGGFTDIAPRGAPDRLLLSELAQDELTLAVRIALNEALYLRREAPPRNPPEERWLLVDVGIRAWGIPRVFAAGVALAAGATTRGGLCAFHTAKGKPEAFDLTTAEGLTAHLAALDTAAHPGAALQQVVRLALAEARAPELLLVTTADALADRKFVETLEALPPLSFYIAAIDRDGGFRLVQHTPRGFLPVRTAQLDLAVLMAPKQRTQPLRDRSGGQLPAIFYVRPFPLRLPYAAKAKNSWFVRSVGVFTVTDDRRLLLWDEPGRYARQFAARLPHGNFFAGSPERRGDLVHAVIGPMQPGSLYGMTIDLAQDTCRLAILGNGYATAREIYIRDEVALLLDGNHVAAFHLQTGELLASADAHHDLKRVRSRFFTKRLSNSDIAWIAASFDGSQIRFDQFAEDDPIECKVAMILAMDVVGVEGPVGILGTGDIYFVYGETLKQRIVSKEKLNDARDRKQPSESAANRFVKQVTAIARDGSRFTIQTHESARVNAQQLVFTLNASERRTSEIGQDAVELEIAALLRPVTMRHRFSGICATANGEVALVSRRGNAWPIAAFVNHGRVTLAKQPTGLSAERVYPFETIERDDISGFSLSRASLPDGSAAWLDTRGLLHLQSAGGALAEATIVLTEGETSGWLSTGACWGSPAMVDRPSGDAVKELRTILSHFAARMR